ncbi:protein-tyrosine-phosphatase [Thiomicrorhabdus sp. 6S3-12]|uniref:fused DSP-PTPase phosphatase/NAD kinase-like protein n=1 Tax=Thiomicrorhabdus sp. 6S3-12 TaxID=2819681 RepID=UPI001AAC6052|nr:protein-tyrosine-phosphatase [Thiomicrorhabdus sp. 6S3-12]MBO1923735.1 protein-tyrosine-phosphatase [Thiomicrorhabdus sp. 6S3-12]
MYFTDHGFLRAMTFFNKYWIDNQALRMSQPSPAEIRNLSKKGIKTILNLRGKNPYGSYPLEIEACKKYGVKMIDIQGIYSRDLPTKDVIRNLKHIFDTAEYPLALHCKSGADRAGIVSTFYQIMVQNKPVEDAVKQLSLKYGHIKQSKTGMLDHLFATYQKDIDQEPMDFMEWVETKYDRNRTKQNFSDSWWASTLVDKLLRRE